MPWEIGASVIWNTAASVFCFGAGVITYFYYRDNKGLWNTLPSFSTGVGVLLTFSVLYWNLGIGKINWSDEKLIAKIVPELINAFSTSIIGIGFSLVYSIRNKYIFHRDNQNEASNKPYLNIHPNELLHYIQKGIEVLNSENEGLKGAIISLKSSNETQMQALTEAINNVVKNINDKLNTAIDTLQGQLERYINTMFNAIDELVKNANDEVKSTIVELQGQLEKHIKTIGENAIQLSSKNISALNDHFLSDSKALIQGNSEVLSNQFESIETVFKDLTSKIENLTNDFNNQSSTTQTAFNQAVQSMTSNIGSETESMVNNTRNQLSDTVEKTNIILNQNLKNLEDTFSSIQKWQQTSKSALEETTKQFTEAVQQYQSIGEQNNAVLEEVKKQFLVIERLRMQEQELIDAISNYDNTLDTSISKIQDIHNVISKLGEIESRLAKLTR